MEFNSLIFPSPTPSYTAFTLNRLMWIPRSRFFSMKTFVKLDKFENILSEAKSYSDKEPTMKNTSGTFLIIASHI
jgi:hypothetical protein